MFCTLLTLLGLLTMGASAPLLTIQSPDGDLVDCIRREDQIAFQHPLLRDHQMLDLPTGMSRATNIEEEHNWQVWHGSGTRCPVGSVPIRRITFHHQNDTPSLTAGQRATQGHEYAEGRLDQGDVEVYGTQVTMSVWRPRIEGFNEFSLGQTWIITGSYDDDNLNTLEAGWQVYPHLYGDDGPRFFTLWTADTYHGPPCYNTRCAGFMQVSQTVLVEGAIDRTSEYGGAPVDLTIRIWMDSKQGCWWLGVILEYGVLVPVGYWPLVLFTGLREHAEFVKWGGEIINTKPFGRHTRTQMGSGFLPESGYRLAAYMRNLTIATVENVFEPVQVMKLSATVPHIYHSSFNKSDVPALGAHFFYGGPHPNPHASAFRYSWNMHFLFLCFALVCLV